MSTSYFIHCTACHESLSSFEACFYEQRLLHAIIANAYDIPTIGKLLDATCGEMSLTAGDSRRLDPHWFSRHRGAHHPLVIIDEYGRIDGACGKRYTCERCTTMHYCSLEKEHDGECRGRV